MREFISLVQRGMTELEYSNKSTELSNFAEALVATEELKENRFIKGLQTDIRKDVHMHEPIKYAKDLNKAFVIEESNGVLYGNTQPKPSWNKQSNSLAQEPPKRQRTEDSMECDFCGRTTI